MGRDLRGERQKVEKRSKLPEKRRGVGERSIAESLQERRTHCGRDKVAAALLGFRWVEAIHRWILHFTTPPPPAKSLDMLIRGGVLEFGCPSYEGQKGRLNIDYLK